MDVYPAGETPVPGVTGKTFLSVVLGHEGHPPASYVPRRVEVVGHLMASLAFAPATWSSPWAPAT